MNQKKQNNRSNLGAGTREFNEPPEMFWCISFSVRSITDNWYPHFLFPGAEKRRVWDGVQDGEPVRDSNFILLYFYWSSFSRTFVILWTSSWVSPSMTALTMSPTMFCMMRRVMAVGHCSVIIRPPKPMVTWTSMENRKADVNDLERERVRERVSVWRQFQFHSVSGPTLSFWQTWWEKQL